MRVVRAGVCHPSGARGPPHLRRAPQGVRPARPAAAEPGTSRERHPGAGAGRVPLPVTPPRGPPPATGSQGGPRVPRQRTGTEMREQRLREPREQGWERGRPARAGELGSRRGSRGAPGAGKTELRAAHPRSCARERPGSCGGAAPPRRRGPATGHSWAAEHPGAKARGRRIRSSWT